MGPFGKKPTPPSAESPEYRGGCSQHAMRGPARSTFEAANKDAIDHGRRMHGSPNYPSAYVERRK